MGRPPFVFVILACLVVMPASLTKPSFAQDAASAIKPKQPVPDEVAIEAIASDISETVDALVRRNAGDRSKLVKDFDQLATSELDPVRKYAMYKEAIKIGKKIGDVEIFLRNMGAIERGYDMDTTPLWAESIIKFAQTSRNPADHLRLLSYRAMTLRRAIDENDFATASRLALISTKGLPNAYRGSADYAFEVLKRLVKTRKQLHEQYTRNMVALIERPDDPTLNLDCGLYEWLILDDRIAGDLHLMKSDDKRVLPILELERKEAKSLAELRKLALLWSFVASELDDVYRLPALRIAADLFDGIADQLSGLGEVAAESTFKSYWDKSLVQGLKTNMLHETFPRIIQQGEYQTRPNRIVLNHNEGSNCLFQYRIPESYDLEYEIQIQPQLGEWRLAFPFTFCHRRNTFSASGTIGSMPGINGGDIMQNRFHGFQGLDDLPSFHLLIRVRTNRVDSYLDGIRVSKLMNPRTVNVGDLSYLPAHIVESDGPSVVDIWGTLTIQSAVLTEYW